MVGSSIGGKEGGWGLVGGHLSPPRLTVDKAAADAVDRRKIRPAGQTSFNAGLVGVLPNSRKDHCRMEAVENC